MYFSSKILKEIRERLWETMSRAHAWKKCQQHPTIHQFSLYPIRIEQVTGRFRKKARPAADFFETNKRDQRLSEMIAESIDLEILWNFSFMYRKIKELSHFFFFWVFKLSEALHTFNCKLGASFRSKQSMQARSRLIFTCLCSCLLVNIKWIIEKWKSGRNLTICVRNGCSLVCEWKTFAQILRFCFLSCSPWQNSERGSVILFRKKFTKFLFIKVFLFAKGKFTAV